MKNGYTSFIPAYVCALQNTVTNRRGPLLPKKNARPHETLRHLKAISSERAEKKAAVVEKRKVRTDTQRRSSRECLLRLAVI